MSVPPPLFWCMALQATGLPHFQPCCCLPPNPHRGVAKGSWDPVSHWEVSGLSSCGPQAWPECENPNFPLLLPVFLRRSLEVATWLTHHGAGEHTQLELLFK